MTDLLNAALTIGVIAFLTSPIWYPIMAANRVLDAAERERRERRKGRG
jgi:membrane glycosyltransferase